MTTQMFQNYLIHLGLFRLTIKVDVFGAYAKVNSEPDAQRFTQVTKIEGAPYWEVRLSSKDFHNKKITDGFFDMKTEINGGKLENAGWQSPCDPRCWHKNDFTVWLWDRWTLEKGDKREVISSDVKSMEELDLLTNPKQSQ